MGTKGQKPAACGCSVAAAATKISDTCFLGILICKSLSTLTAAAACNEEPLALACIAACHIIEKPAIIGTQHGLDLC